MEQETRVTLFGAVLGRIMATRGIKHYRALSSMLKERGHHYSAERIANWRAGRHPVARLFPHALHDTLTLGEREIDLLGQAYTWGQEVFIDAFGKVHEMPPGTPDYVLREFREDLAA